MRPRPFGLIGGLGPPSTILYYRALIVEHAARGCAPRLFIAHADVELALSFVAREDPAGLADYLASLIEPLARAGAEFVAIGAVTPHVCMPNLVEKSPLPIVDIAEVLVERLEVLRLRRLAVLGTRFTMQSGLFGRLAAFDLVALDAATQAETHRIYLSVIAQGRADPVDAAWLKTLGRDLHERQGAEAIVVAGTELSLVLSEGQEAFPIVDAAQSHVEAITARAFAAADAVATGAAAT